MKNIIYDINEQSLNKTWLESKLDQCSNIYNAVKVLRNLVGQAVETPFMNYSAASELGVSLTEFSSAMDELTRVGIIRVEYANDK